MGLLDGKVVLVTGGARGQGRAHAVRSASEGADVVVLDVGDGAPSPAPYPLATAGDLAATVDEVRSTGRRALGLVADVRSQEQLDAAVAAALTEFGRIDAVVANAGVWAGGRFWEISEADWTDMVDIDLNGVWRTVKAVAPHLVERRAGSIVLTASTDSIETGHGYAHYVAAKHGVVGLLKAFALELAEFGIRCNAVSPGVVDTALLNNTFAYERIAGHPGGTREEFLDSVYHYNALRGLTAQAPERIAEAVVFLLSDQASTITGVNLPVEGGHLLLQGRNHAPVRD
ncbi:mycofactocin-coupled SDR family oxidoreductase [Pseudonocardia alni]|uniref:mycofactocin-coupled SDR family oxidoreductase n=1 Tax=Pseudonocardia alni TaxID=33907 RepID=UPI0033E69CFC